MSEFVVDILQFGGREAISIGERVVRCRDCSMAEYDNWVDTENVS